MYHAVRAAVRHVREPTAEERAELARATPETRAFLTVKIAEERNGRRSTAAEIRHLAVETMAYANALAEIADARELEESGICPLPFTLEELAADADEAAAMRAAEKQPPPDISPWWPNR